MQVGNLAAASLGNELFTLTMSHSDQASLVNPDYWTSFTCASWLDAEILQTLPNSTLAIDTMDEAKIVAPYDMLSRVLCVAHAPRTTPLPPSD